MKRNRELGQAIVLVALGLVVLLGMLGLGIDFGYLRYQKRQMQTAADAGAVAAAGMLDFGMSSSITTAGRAASAQNGFTNGTSGVTVAVNNPPSSLPIAQDPHNGNNKYVEVVVSQNQPTFFTKAFGVSSVPLSARAEGAEGGGNNCIFSLDPSGRPGVGVDGLAALNSACGIVDESSNSTDALSCGLIAQISASSIGVVGGVQQFLCLGIHPTPTTIRTPSPADPLAATPKPVVGACPANLGGAVSSGTFTGAKTGLNISAGGTVTLNPGVYCGGIKANFGAKINFTPGTYILANASSGSTYGLTVDLGTTINGPGVTFYNYGTSGAITFGFSSFLTGGVNLVAPTSGTYEGILFFQDPGNTQQATIIGTSSINTTLQGTYYFPKAKVVFAFDGLVDYDILVAYDIEFEAFTFPSGTVTGNFTANYTTLANGSPIKGGNGVLVE